jgi:hypothetical protein
VGTRAGVAALLVGVPAFGAAVCFSHLFRDEPVTGYPLGVCLVGAMVGLSLALLSAVTGMGSLWLIAAAAWGLAGLTAATLRRAGARGPGS